MLQLDNDANVLLIAPRYPSSPFRTVPVPVGLGCLSIDIGVTHEGEAKLGDLLSGRELSEIRAVLYRNCEGGIEYTGNAPLIRVFQ